jgi:hypothetical protein
MKRLLGVSVALSALAVFLVFVSGPATALEDPPLPPLAAAALGQLQPAKVTVNGVTKTMPFFSDGALATAQEVLNKGGSAVPAGPAPQPASTDNPPTGTATDELGIAPFSYGCGRRDRQNETLTGTSGNSRNVRVNQDCTFRRQAEEDITFNPLDRTNLLAGQNDSGLGYNQCGIDFSLNSGNHWGHLYPPYRQHENDPTTMEPGQGGNTNRNTILGGPGTEHTYDAASDPTVAFDSQGRGYFSCIIFDVVDLEELVRGAASGLYVTQSPKGAKGSFFFNVPPRGKRFMVVEDNNPNVFHDKQFITADYHSASPNRDNVYVTWTVFTFAAGLVYVQSPIYGSMSTDGGVSWSTPEEISGFDLQLCPFPVTIPGTCNANQGSDPIVLPNGDLVVTFYNANTPTLGVNQILAVICHPAGKSELGTADLNCEQTPRRVGTVDEVDAPVCSFGRQCIPGAFIRTNPFPRIEVNIENGHIYVVWQDHGRRDNPAVREWSIQLSRSTDGGNTWTLERTVNPTTNLDHYFPAVDIAEINGEDRVAVSYYRTQVPADQSGGQGATTTCGPTGTSVCNSDYVLAGGTSILTPFVYKVLTPLFPPPDGIQAGFNGDYSGVTIPKGVETHPIWSDTRNRDPYRPANGVDHDEDIFTTNVGLPNGQATVTKGQIGK